MTTCPHHPGRTGNELPECRWCIQEAVLAGLSGADRAGLAAVRAQIPQHRTEDTTPRGRAIARARAERKTHS